MSKVVFEDKNVIISGNKKIRGKVIAPGSKSVAHRELICAALSNSESVIFCKGKSADILATADCLTALGADIKFADSAIFVNPIKTPPKSATLFCRESGTTLRFMIPLAAFLGVETTFVCEPSLARRPVSVLCDELSLHGINFPQGYTFPLHMSGKATPGEWQIRGDISSQYISGLLLSFPLAKEKSSLKILGKCESLPYIDITTRCMSENGIDLSFSDGYYTVSGGSYTGKGDFESPFNIEGDWSGAAFWLAAGLSSEEGIEIGGLLSASAQGDKKILSILKSAGADITESNGKITVKKSKIYSFECDCTHTPDLVPILSVCAAIAEGESKIHGIERLRLKESDRIASSISLLSSLGIEGEYKNGTLTVFGGKIKGGNVDGHNDHRIVMSAAIASLFTEEKTAISDAYAVEKSYPEFWNDFSTLIRE